MSAIIDFHSHILPGIDDGSSSLDESIAMLHTAQEQGISKIVATPHFYARSDDLNQFLKRRSHAEEQLRGEMARHPGLPELYVGAEVSFFSGMADSDAITRLAIANSRYILIEMPFSTWTNSTYSELQRIHDKQGLTPIIAHIDRYISRFHYHGILRGLEELPVIIQCNAEAFLKRHTASLVLRMLTNGQIHVLGSDCHNTYSRPPNLGEALRIIRNKLGEEGFEDFLCYAETILEEQHKSLVHCTIK